MQTAFAGLLVMWFITSFVYLWLDRNAWRSEATAAVEQRDELRWLVESIREQLERMREQ